MNRISIVLASILKPVNDTRMYEKIGLSLSQTNKYEVNIIGFSEKNIFYTDHVTFYPLFSFPRLSIKRVFSGFIFFAYLLKLKPKIIIVNTYELLIVTSIYKCIYSTQFLYDVQENYYLNILCNKQIPFGVRQALAYAARLTERITLPFIDKCLVAEEGYFKEMPYLKGKSIFLPNKYIDPPGYKQTIPNRTEKIKFLYSGTISQNYGIYNVLHFITGFHAYHNDIELTIIGYCADKRLLNRLLDQISTKPYIRLIGGNALVPHKEIVEYINCSDFGIVNYQLDRSLINCFPTKIYEYMANRLPIIIQNNAPWTSFVTKHNAGIEVDFSNVDYPALFNQMQNKRLYTQAIPPKEIYWSATELLHFLE